MARPAIVTDIIPAACERAAITPDQIIENAQVRVSVNSIAELRAQVSAATDVFGAHATVGPFVRELPALFDESATEDDRAAAGLRRVTEADLLAEHPGRGRVGWVTVLAGERGNPEAPAVLVTITTNSSITKNLVRSDGTEENAYQLLFTQSWRAIPNAHVARFVRDDRMSRLLSVFALINEAIGDRPGAWYAWGDEVLDPSRDTWRGVIGAASSAEDATRNKVKLMAGLVGRMRANIWPQDSKDLPLGLVQPTRITPDGLVKQIEGPPEIDDISARLATTILRGLARGGTAPQVGVEAAVQGLRNGDGTLVLLKIAPLLTDAQAAHVQDEVLPTLTSHEAQAVQTALDRRADKTSKAAKDVARRAAIEAVRRVAQHADFYRTGKFHWILKGSITGRLDYSGRKPTFPYDEHASVPPTVPEDQVVRVGDLPTWHTWHRKTSQWQKQARRYGFFSQTFEWPSPVELADTEWEALDEVLATHPTWGYRRSPQHRRNPNRPCGPLSQLSWTLGDGEHAEAWSLTLDHRAYQVWRGPVPADGQLWSQIRTPVARIAATGMHRALGQCLVGLGEQMDAAPDPLPVLVSTRRQTLNDPVQQAQNHLEQLEAEQARLEGENEGLERERAACAPGSRGHQRKARLIANNDERLEQFDREILAVDRALAEARANPQRPTGESDDEQLDVDANPLLVVGGALLRLADNDQRLGSPQLAQAVAWLLDEGRGLRVTLQDGRHVRVDVKVRVPGQHDLPAILDAGQLHLTRTDKAPRGTSRIARTLHDEAALRVLGEQSADGFLQRTGWSRAFLVQQLRRWLHDRAITAGAASALIDAALHDQTWPAPPVIYAYLTASTSEATKTATAAAETWGCRQVADPILHAYLRGGGDWPTRDTGFVRGRLGPTRRLLALLAAQPGAAANRHAVADHLGIGKRRLHTLLAGHGLGGIAPAQFDATTAWLRRCPNKACDLRGQPMTRLVAVPETLLAPTPFIVVCRGCGQPDTDDGVPLPDLYLRRWDADAARINLHTGSHIVEAPAPSTSWPQLQQRLSANEVARRLELHPTTARKLITTGVLPAMAGRNDRGGWTVLEHDLHRPEVQRAAAQLRRGKRVQRLTCSRCQTSWSRRPQPGRPPTTCPDCCP